MMRKILFTFLTLIPLLIHAQEFRCGYRDYFRIGDEVPADILIASYNDSPEIILQIISPRSFQVRDSQLCRSGYAQVTVASSLAPRQRWCILDIQDGPYMNHPSIKETCQGLSYQGTSYDGWGTHSYTIHLA